MGAAFTLFLSAFLAATIVPAASEGVLIVFAAQDVLPLWSLWTVATVGNVLGSCVNWGLGRFFAHWQTHQWFPVQQKTLQRGEVWFQRYGVWSLLFSWVPVIGDPLTVLAGIFRIAFPVFFVMVLFAKGGRYLFLLGIADWIGIGGLSGVALMEGVG